MIFLTDERLRFKNVSDFFFFFRYHSQIKSEVEWKQNSQNAAWYCGRELALGSEKFSFSAYTIYWL